MSIKPLDNWSERSERVQKQCSALGLQKSSSLNNIRSTTGAEAIKEPQKPPHWREMGGKPGKPRNLRVFYVI